LGAGPEPEPVLEGELDPELGELEGAGGGVGAALGPLSALDFCL
jgi:hypothetical protein